MIVSNDTDWRLDGFGQTGNTKTDCRSSALPECGSFFSFSPMEKESGLFLTLRDKESLPQNETPALGILLSGRAVICSADTGRTVILRTLLAGDIFGVAGLFANTEQPLSRTVSDGESAFYLIRKSTIEKLMDQNRPFRENFLAFLSDRVSFLNRKIRCFTAGNAGRRLALFLLCEEHDVIPLPLSYAALPICWISAALRSTALLTS